MEDKQLSMQVLDKNNQSAIRYRSPKNSEYVTDIIRHY